MHPHSSHWGAFQALWSDGRLQVRPHAADPDPSRLIENFPAAVRHRARLAMPMVRRGWLKRGPMPDASRGSDDFVEVSWERALDLLAQELRRVRDEHGPQAIFGGSYGWSSAGRFHHAQSQLHRFLNTALGGYVRSVNTYSAGAAQVMLPHIFGHSMDDVARRNVTWEQVSATTEVVLAFGGLALKNSQVASGGVSRHVERTAIRSAAERGCRFISVSPLRSDMPQEARAEWLPIEPGSDAALMLALMHTLVSEGLHDREFIERCCDGWDVFERYLMGRDDGCAKSASWAAPICKMPASAIEVLARSLAGHRVLVVVAHALQRAEHGEQPVWAGAALAAALGQIGLPGGGYSYALGTMGHYGRRINAVPVAALPQGKNAVEAFIPVARIADMLHHPGQAYPYNGRHLHYPQIRLAYWAGGNPMHHHQDLKRLADGFRRLDTLVVNESAWTATTRLADIVLPCTMTLEREDIGAAPTDPLMVAMHRILSPYGLARDDFDIFSELAERLGHGQAFSEGRNPRQWLAHLYEPTRMALERAGCDAPDFESFWTRGEITLPQLDDDGGVLRAFRSSPQASPLPTPSGKIQISSPVIAGFAYADCPGHPAWLPPAHAPDERHPLWLVANQPERRLHSQLDFGGYSQAGKQQGREVCTMHPSSAQSRGISQGDAVRIFNAIGACLAVVELSEDVMPGVVRLPTGAWYSPFQQPSGQTACAHGNPNSLTRDAGTSSLSQGCTGELVAVQVEKFSGPLPAVLAFEPGPAGAWRLTPSVRRSDTD